MLGKVKIDSLTLPQADSLLVQKYNVFYDSCFVLTSCENRRVTILGAMGNQVIPITNENTNLIEILALAGGAVGEFKSTNIRLIRGDLQNPEVQIVDLSTIEGMKIANLRIQSHDIIYVEPTKKVVNEAIRDISPILSLTTSLITLIILFTANNK
jgi:polysaccharide export outer membrane protein